MIDDQLEQNYVVSKLRSDLPALMDGWADRSAKFRTDADALLDEVYGDHPREKIDIFRCGLEKAPLLVYFHGGYWQRGDKSIYSFVAESFVKQGVDVAVIGYPLCPEVSLTRLVDSVRQSLAYLFRNADRQGLDRQRLNLCGNSAGGHLVAMMIATRWSELDADIPDDLIQFGAALSGLYDLEPLRYTSLNEAIKIDADEARSNSPTFMQSSGNASIMTAVGGTETSVFFTQMDGLIENWQSLRNVESYVEDDADHFDMIDRLGDSTSELFQKIIQRLR